MKYFNLCIRSTFSNAFDQSKESTARLLRVKFPKTKFFLVRIGTIRIRKTSVFEHFLHSGWIKLEFIF